MALEDVVRSLFMKNYTNTEMQVQLHLDHNIQISTRTLKRVLHQLGLRRRRQLNNAAVHAAFLTEVQGSGQRLGCRMMARRLLSSHGLSIGREKVLQLMHQLDPEGVEMRKRHCLTRRTYQNLGPNYLIHIDGYDKLKPFGLANHGAICGYSRKVLWLKVCRSNNDPEVVASIFIDYIREIKGAPRCIRVDAGIENTTIIQMQQALRWYHTDNRSGENSVVIGSSHSNQANFILILLIMCI